MKFKKTIFIFGTFLLCLLTINKSTLTSNALEQFNGQTSPISDTEFYSTDYHIFKKGYYLLIGEGDISCFNLSGNIKTYLYENSNVSISIFENKLGIEAQHKSALNEVISQLNDDFSPFPEDQVLLIRVDNFGKLEYGDGEGCWRCYCYGIETYEEDSSSKTGGKYHVINADNRLSLNDILSKYTFTDNVDSSSNIKVNATTSYNGSATLGAFELFIEAIDQSGNVSTTLDYIYVHDFVAPTIQTSKDTYEIEVNTKLTSKDIEGYFNVQDNFTIPLSLKKTYTDNYNNKYNEVGEYTFTCQVKDQQGNSSSKTITIKVKDSTKPTISLKSGGDTIHSNKELSISEIYQLLDIKDNYDTITEDQVTITTDCKGLEGVQYTINVSVTDSNNNTTTQTYNYYINDTTAPNITVRDTIYLEKGRKYSTEELLSILKAAGIISNNATTVNFIDEELISSSTDEDVYKMTYEETLSDGTVNYGFVTLKYQKPETKNNNVIYYIVPSIALVGFILIQIIKKRKKSKC